MLPHNTTLDNTIYPQEMQSQNKELVKTLMNRRKQNRQRTINIAGRDVLVYDIVIDLEATFDITLEDIPRVAEALVSFSEEDQRLFDAILDAKFVSKS